MKLAKLYSSKILSLRQKLILFGSVTLCVFVTVATYLVVEYFTQAMLVAIADKQAHLRVFLLGDDIQKTNEIVSYLRRNTNVIRCDYGYFYSGDFYVTSHKPPTDFEKRYGEIYFEGFRKINITAYRFDEVGYVPPILLENVYSETNRKVALDSPTDAPIAIVSDPEEARKNYGIVNKSLTKIFPTGPNAFANPYEIKVKDEQGGYKEVPMLTAGYVMDSPLSVVEEPFKIFTRPCVLEQIVPRGEWRVVVDCSVADRQNMTSLEKDVFQICSPEKIQTWRDENPQAEAFLSGLKVCSYFGVCAILAISVVGVGMLISMLIEEKFRQLSILYAIGMDSSQIRTIFLWIGVKVALFACVVGTLSAWLVVSYFLPRLTEIVRIFCQVQAEQLVFKWNDGVVFWCAVVLFCFIVSWLPTRRITMSDPVKYLRSE